MNLTLTHFQRHKHRVFEFDPHRTYEQGPNLNYKPEGLWLSDEFSPHSWTWWAKREGLNWCWCPHEFVVDTSGLLVIDSLEKLRAVPLSSRDEHGFIDSPIPDWNRIARSYTGILVRPCEFDGSMTWTYGWDCDSACVWDLSCITPVAIEEAA